MSEGTDKMVTKKDSEQPLVNHCDGSGSKVTEGPVTSRRTFTRNVLAGSAVLLTLTNRSAWGLVELGGNVKCMSTSVLMSFRTGQASAFTGEQEEEIRKFEQYISQATEEPEIIGTDTCVLLDDSGTPPTPPTSNSSRLWFNPMK